MSALDNPYSPSGPGFRKKTKSLSCRSSASAAAFTLTRGRVSGPCRTRFTSMLSCQRPLKSSIDPSQVARATRPSSTTCLHTSSFPDGLAPAAHGSDRATEARTGAKRRFITRRCDDTSSDVNRAHLEAALTLLSHSERQTWRRQPCNPTRGQAPGGGIDTGAELPVPAGRTNGQALLGKRSVSAIASAEVAKFIWDVAAAKTAAQAKPTVKALRAKSLRNAALMAAETRRRAIRRSRAARAPLAARWAARA